MKGEGEVTEVETGSHGNNTVLWESGGVPLIGSAWLGQQNSAELTVVPAETQGCPALGVQSGEEEKAVDAG